MNKVFYCVLVAFFLSTACRGQESENEFTWIKTPTKVTPKFSDWESMSAEDRQTFCGFYVFAISRTNLCSSEVRVKSMNVKFINDSANELYNAIESRWKDFHQSREITDLAFKILEEKGWFQFYFEIEGVQFSNLRINKTYSSWELVGTAFNNTAKELSIGNFNIEWWHNEELKDVDSLSITQLRSGETQSFSTPVNLSGHSPELKNMKISKAAAYFND